MRSGRGTAFRGHIGLAVTALVAVLFLLVAATPAAHADPSLMGEWHMDQVNAGSPSTTPDSSGNGHALQVLGPSQVSGRWGQAFAFSASGDALKATSTYEPAHVTAMAWVKASSSPGSYKDVLSQGGDPSCSVASYALYTGPSGGLQFYIATNTTTTINSAAEPSASLWDGNWHAVAGVYDGSTVTLYVDGVQVGSPTNATGSAIDYGLSDSTFEIGNFHPCAGFNFSGGSIDEVRIYNRALSYAEIVKLQSSSATSPPELTADPTSTSVNCAPGSTTVGTPVTCTATVAPAGRAGMRPWWGNT